MVKSCEHLVDMDFSDVFGLNQSFFLDDNKLALSGSGAYLSLTYSTRNRTSASANCWDGILAPLFAFMSDSVVVYVSSEPFTPYTGKQILNAL